MKRILIALAIVAVTPKPAHAFVPPDIEPRRTPAPAASPSAPPVQMPTLGAQGLVPLPLGLYRVTEVYVADVVTRAGDLTTYSTRTRQQVTDTFARVLERVETGARSNYDGRAFNGRAALTDGGLVAGTYYENFVFDGARYRPVSIVFFQDDSELARRRAASPAPAPTRAPAATTAPIATAPRPAAVVPPQVRTTPAPTLGPITVGVDPTGGAAILDRIEVARGARYPLRVNVRGSATLVAWSLVAGVNDAPNTAGWHAATEPLVGQWLRLPPPGETWTITLRVRVAPLSGGQLVERDAAIRVSVRSPAIVE